MCTVQRNAYRSMKHLKRNQGERERERSNCLRHLEESKRDGRSSYNIAEVD
jgi:hypothetical protein